jgi:predicted amidohydrolase
MARKPPTRRKRPPPRNKRIVAAAVQLEAEVGNVAANLQPIERLVDEAAAGARLVAVPEFGTSGLPFDPDAHAAVLPPDKDLPTI